MWSYDKKTEKENMRFFLSNLLRNFSQHFTKRISAPRERERLRVRRTLSRPLGAAALASNDVPLALEKYRAPGVREYECRERRHRTISASVELKLEFYDGKSREKRDSLETEWKKGI